MKMHVINAFFGSICLLASFLLPVKVAPTAFLLGIVFMVVACVLVTMERYNESELERHNRNRRKF